MNGKQIAGMVCIMLSGILFALALLMAMTGAARGAEGETVKVDQVTCQALTMSGSGYTPGQTLLLFAKAPQGEGTITDPIEVKADAQGMFQATLQFGGQLPNGLYHAVVTTPGPGQQETVTAEFQVHGACLSGEHAVSAKADCESVTVTGTGWEQTEASVEAVVLGEGKMTKQVFPDEQGKFSAVIPWSSPPTGGERTAEGRIDGITRAEVNFTAPVCTGTGPGTLPFTGFGARTWFAGLIATILILAGIVILLMLRRISRD